MVGGAGSDAVAWQGCLRPPPVGYGSGVHTASGTPGPSPGDTAAFGSLAAGVCGRGLRGW